MTLMFTQGHRKARTCAVIQLPEATQMFMMVGYVRKITMKSCKYGEYESFEHLLFLFVYLLSFVVGWFVF